MANFTGLNVFFRPQTLPPTALYGYVPSETATLAFIILFAISTVIHFGQAVYTRLWWLIPTICVCGGLEVAGWSGRFWSHHNPINYSAYLLQICTTIMAPTFLLAANFVIFGHIIERLGTSYSRLPPKWYSILFITCDVIALIIQGTGGGLASAHIKTNPTPGGNVMLGGITFQLGRSVIVVYTFLAAEFFIRYMSNKPFRKSMSYTESFIDPKPMTRKIMIMSLGIAFCTLCLFIRSVYRVIELAGGWLGRIIRTEVYFNVLDGAMITLALYTFNFIHPGYFLADDDDDGSEKALGK
ncbi:hypothetical protein C0989_008059 [Termitomyces sp. Mn162]|nr:hypothetical protein C0989_008059 [Termitomyces sp. Mn162]